MKVKKKLKKKRLSVNYKPIPMELEEVYSSNEYVSIDVLESRIKRAITSGYNIVGYDQVEIQVEMSYVHNTDDFDLSTDFY